MRADHKMLLPDGIAQMEFHVLAYGAQEFTTYEIEEVEGQDQYVIGTSRDTFEIPLDRLPEGCIKVYDDAGREVKDMIILRPIGISGKLPFMRRLEMYKVIP